MSGDWTIPSRKEVRKRAATVRDTWSPMERDRRRHGLPPDSALRTAPAEFWGPSRHPAIEAGFVRLHCRLAAAQPA